MCEKKLLFDVNHFYTSHADLLDDYLSAFGKCKELIHGLYPHSLPLSVPDLGCIEDTSTQLAAEIP